MKILVYDIAAEDGGGIFVLKNFYKEVVESTGMYPEVEWVFMTSFKLLEEVKGIKILNYDWIKKSWIHRFLFEEFCIQTILKELNINCVISLQNMPIKHCKLKQYVYMHQSLQFCPKKFSVMKKEERSLAVRQKIICNIYRRELKKANHIFVQTSWIKDATKKWLGCSRSRVTVTPVEINNSPHNIFDYTGHKTKTFFYPARGELYKNHDVIINACKILAQKGIKNYKVIFTINKDDNIYTKRIFENAQGLPIEFVGQVGYEKMWEYYSKTVLLFPSYLETCGLPLIEAKSIGSIILVSDMPFSKEQLSDYKNVYYFDFNNADQLASEMIKVIEGKNQYYHDQDTNAYKNQPISLLKSIMKIIEEENDEKKIIDHILS